MKAKEIRRRTSADLVEEVRRLRQEVFDRRFRAQSEEKAERGHVGRARKDIARILTILSERARGQSPEPASGKKES